VTQNFIFLSTNSLWPFHTTERLGLARLLQQRRPIKHLPRNHGRESPSSLRGSASRVRTSAVDGSDGGLHSSVCMPCLLGASQLGDKRGAQSQSLLRTRRSLTAGQSCGSASSSAPSVRPSPHLQSQTTTISDTQHQSSHRACARPSTLPPAVRTAISGSCSQLEGLLLDDTKLTTIPRMTPDLRTKCLTEGVRRDWFNPYVHNLVSISDCIHS